MWNKNTPARLHPAKDEPSLHFDWRVVLLLLGMVFIFILLIVIVFHLGGTESGMYYNRMEYLI